MISSTIRKKCHHALCYGMAQLFLLFPFFSSSAFAQDDRSTLQFNEGTYSGQPIFYPSTLSKSDVRALIKAIEQVSDGEISLILSVPVEADRSLANTVTVLLCAKGARSRDDCHGGESYRFEKMDDQWVLRKGIGTWVE